MARCRGWEGDGGSNEWLPPVELARSNPSQRHPRFCGVYLTALAQQQLQHRRAGASEWHRELERPAVVMDRASDDVGSVTITCADECSSPRVKIEADSFLLAAEIKSRDYPDRFEIR
jgi:hypothetical protein